MEIELPAVLAFLPDILVRNSVDVGYSINWRRTEAFPWLGRELQCSRK
jgi:hypothetical protein